MKITVKIIALRIRMILGLEIALLSTQIDHLVLLGAVSNIKNLFLSVIEDNVL